MSARADQVVGAGAGPKRWTWESGIIENRDIEEGVMSNARFVYWQDDDVWLGYLEEYPDYRTQGKSLEELKENLRDIYEDVNSGAIPFVRRVAELEIA